MPLPVTPLRCFSRHPTRLAHLVVLSVTATTVLQSLVNGALTVALPSIADDLGLPADQLQWPMACLSLSNGALLLIAGAVADTIAGRRLTFLAGLAAFAVSCIATAFVRSGAQLSALCACIGAAAAMLSPAGVGILASCLPNHGQTKSRAFAALGAGQPVGFIIGLLLGGILSTGGHWRVIFFITAGLAALFLVLCVLALPPDNTLIVFTPLTRHADGPLPGSDSTRHLTSGTTTPARSEHDHASQTAGSHTDLHRVSSLVPIASDASKPTLAQALKHFDWIGAFLSTSGLVLLTFALADAETAPQGWRTPYIPAMLPLSCLALSSFVLWERRLERAVLAKRQRGETGLAFEPLLPPSIWRAPRFGILLTIVFAAWLSFNCLSYYITVFIQVVQKVSPLQTSLRFLPMVAGGIAINVLSGYLMPRIRPIWMIALGSTGGAAAAILFACLDPSSGYWAGGMFFVMLLVVATDFAFPVAQLFSVRSVGPQHAALAGSLFSTTVRVASSIGLALTSAISTAVARAYAARHGATAAAAEGESHLDALSPEALLRGYRAAGWTCAGFSLLAVVLACLSLRSVGPLRSEELADAEATLAPKKEADVAARVSDAKQGGDAKATPSAEARSLGLEHGGFGSAAEEQEEKDAAKTTVAAMLTGPSGVGMGPSFTGAAAVEAVELQTFARERAGPSSPSTTAPSAA